MSSMVGAMSSMDGEVSSMDGAMSSMDGEVSSVDIIHGWKYITHRQKNFIHDESVIWGLWNLKMYPQYF